ncbi:MAG TPA: PAS domain-containing protein [Caulobacteraceae bacterium]|jgi:PAS domain-containing protein|nr:PAS domain-containing protein [Caulobacteraceae bacterium]
MSSTTYADEMLSRAIDAVERGGPDLYSVLEALPAPIYVTDPHGVVTHFNRACIGLAGRTPAVGKDRWCVTWKLYTEDGEFLPHDQCPMAAAIRSRSPVRGVSAVAERPDGSRVSFVPFPTPLFGANGELLGAINMLVDVTDDRQIDELWAQARRCRRLGAGACDQSIADTLGLMAVEYETKARDLELTCARRRA